MDIKYTSKVQQFLSKYKFLKDGALDDMGKAGVDNIKNKTPVRTGELRDANDYEIRDSNIYFTNDIEYAPYVELGTSQMSAQPFMRRGINDSKSDFLRIIIKNLKI